MRPQGDKQCAACGLWYWQKAAWQHANCGGVIKFKAVGGPTLTTCNQCVTKDAEIERLRNQIAAMQPKAPKRDRAAYMREYRKS